jgi:hypothetical protein
MEPARHGNVNPKQVEATFAREGEEGKQYETDACGEDGGKNSYRHSREG